MRNSNIMQGKIVKGIAGFYYVHVVGSGVYECKAKGVFRKDGIKPLVGDDAEIEILDEKDMEGNITKILPRKNELIRPAVANIDQALVVFAVTEPEPHFNLLDRFLVMMERKDIPTVLCFNKTDIAESPDIEKLDEIYRGCGCPLVFTSAREQINIERLKAFLKGKTTAIAGPSGVGKSSLINLIQPHVQMETGNISRKIVLKSLKWLRLIKRLFTAPGKAKYHLVNTGLRMTGHYAGMKGLLNQRKDNSKCRVSNEELMKRFDSAVDLAVRMIVSLDESIWTRKELDERFDRTFS